MSCDTMLGFDTVGSGSEWRIDGTVGSDPTLATELYRPVGTSFGDVPLPTEQFAMGLPFRLSAYDAGEIIGPNYYVATAGYLRHIGRLPDFLGDRSSPAAGSRMATRSGNGPWPAGEPTAASAS